MSYFLRDYALSAPEPALTMLWFVKVESGEAVTYLLAEQMTATFPKIPAQARFAAGSNDYFPGIRDIDSVAITFYETHDYQVSAWLKKWRDSICDVRGNYGLPAQYKKKITLNLFSKAAQKPVKTIVYKDCWPSDQGAFELNYSDETGRLVVQATFSVDEIDD